MYYTHGLRWHKLYMVWYGMMTRCYDKDHPSYKRYGKRGIKVEARWHEVSNFIADAVGWEEGLSIDRKNNNGHYTRKNCRWVTWKEQNNNTSANRKITFKGETKTLTQWAESIGISVSLLRKRLRNWGTEKAITQPLDKRKSFKRNRHADNA